MVVVRLCPFLNYNIGVNWSSFFDVSPFFALLVTFNMRGYYSISPIFKLYDEMIKSNIFIEFLMVKPW